MADFKPRPGTFLPYLEASERRNSPVPSDAPASPLSLLVILARQSKQSLPLFDLQTLSGMQPSRYAEALKSLKDAGFITIEGEAPEQTVRLTASGAQVVQLADLPKPWTGVGLTGSPSRYWAAWSEPANWPPVTKTTHGPQLRRGQRFSRLRSTARHRLARSA